MLFSPNPFSPDPFPSPSPPFPFRSASLSVPAFLLIEDRPPNYHRKGSLSRLASSVVVFEIEASVASGIGCR
ncbi:hypothetical protein MLD38_007835 [Melastoma candidum]|uniref:Uncharacterized protein n=1 Tax=Melastoma candidum TaxID=119954 RepID=A0ACB9RRJ4_9MYRT|nr:hypothetical protein MLD38_007835 [Melastoma candidum]